MSDLEEQLTKRVLFLDGAMGTSVYGQDLDLQQDYLGKENCTEVLVLSRPDVVQFIHESFLKVGADAVETNTFGANKLVLDEFELAHQTYDINKQAAEIARAACQNFTTPGKPRFVLGSIGPGTKLPTLGHTDWDTLLDSYAEQAQGLIDGGADALLIETAQDLLQVKCAINACLHALDQRHRTIDQIPLLVQVTIETSGTMLLGTEIAAAATALRQFPILCLGLNCATGPVEMAEHLQWLGRHWTRYISVVPNAGLPTLVEGRTEYPLKPQPFAQKMLEFVESFAVNLIGGCCGSTPEHIAALIEAVGDRPPASVQKDPAGPGCSSLYGATEYRQDASILNIGERTNASGSRKFKRLLEEEDWDQIVSLAREMVREGSHLIDVNVDYAGRDNPADMAQIVSRIVQQVNVPLVLDSTQPATIEAGLKCAGGKCIINSANLEEGEEQFARMCRLARRYGAGLVLGCIDEDPEEAMARTADRKQAIAQRMLKLATDKYGLDPADLLFDPLVLPISTGMTKDRRSGLETIEGTRRIAQHFPQCQITCGLSNISFGLKPVARQVLNSVFLHELIEAGLTSAILHVSKILPRNRIPDDQWAAALNLIYDSRRPQAKTHNDGSDDPLQIFINLFPEDAAPQDTREQLRELPLEERLGKHIIDGEKQGLIETLDEALKHYDPLQIINEQLLKGMKVVGELFGSGQMQLPFVLQSAEVMKMAVAHLEPLMEKAEGQTKGSIILATVKGDVHDIGKNLVDIILTNNGYTVHNLGIKQPISNILAKWKELRTDAIGLSGLLVKSVTVMKDNLEDLNHQKIMIPILLGGAALSRHYCEGQLRPIYHGNLFYGQDAFEGLRIMDHLARGQTDALDREIADRLSKRADTEAKIEATQLKRLAAGAETADIAAADAAAAAITAGRSEKQLETAVPPPPFFGDRVIEHVGLDQIYPFINKVALFRGQWQFKKGRKSDAEYQAQIEDQVKPLFEKLKAEMRDQGVLQPQLVYGYFPCASRGNELLIFDPQDQDRQIEHFNFPRQNRGKHLCISDFFKPLDSGLKDVVGLTCVTMGSRVGDEARSLFEANQYRDYLYIHGMGVECAEALAELWHKRMRQELGIDGDDAPSVSDLFTQHYRGSRYSFGYPACPDLSDQEKLFRLLRPQRIGCTLTENFQIEPEQSTSAIVVHHPDARYFNV